MKFGRLPRTRDPRVPHFSAMIAGMTLDPVPEAVDWTVGMPTDWGQMLNNELGCCTCAAAYHAMQLWSQHARQFEITEPDAKVLQMYEEFCGYQPGHPDTDQGGVEQEVLARWFNPGVPIVEGNGGRSRLQAYVEIDPRQHDDVKRAINDCGCVYIGFNVPQFVADSTSAEKPWDVVPGQDETIVGGHAVIAPGYDADGLRIVSWGLATYRMTWAFFDRFVDEAYALSHPWWVDAKGTTPGNLTIEALNAAMAALREPGAPIAVRP
jgi:hypothetical protein